MSETSWFLVIVLGWPATLLFLAILTGHFYGSDYRELLDWKPTRSPAREAELERHELEQMLAALNKYRRQRGAPERSPKEVVEQGPADLRPYLEAILPPE
jgi:hypothetical protein